MDAEDARCATAGQPCVEGDRFWELNARSERAAVALRAASCARDVPAAAAEQAAGDYPAVVLDVRSHDTTAEENYALQRTYEVATERGDATGTGV
jgi:hypothetical protein